MNLMTVINVNLILALIGSAESRSLITLLPDDPVGLVGENMMLWCTLSDTSLRSEDLGFTYTYYNDWKHNDVNPNDTIRLNITTSALILRNLTDDFHHATVFCLYNRTSRGAAQILTVGRPPAEPKVNYYRFFNWEQFIFRWIIRSKNVAFKTKYTAWFKSSLDLDFTSCDGTLCLGDPSQCITQIGNTCTVPKSFLKSVFFDCYIHFKVNGTNRAGNVTSPILTRSILEAVEPKTVEFLAVESKSGYDEVRFRTPTETQHLNYDIHLQSNENKSDFRSFNEIYKHKKTATIRLTDLNPYTQYTLSIRSKFPIVPIGRKRIWSNWTNVTFTSHEEAPSKAPDVCGSCFEMKREAEDRTEDRRETEGRTALIYFKPLTKEQSRGAIWYNIRVRSNSADAVFHGAPVGYKTSVGESFGVKNFETHSTSLQKGTSEAAEFLLSNLSNSAEYIINIHANTSAGNSQSASVKIPMKDEMPLPPDNCSVMLFDKNPKHVVFRWNNMLPDARQKLGICTVAWCKGSLYRMRCEQPMEWKEVGPDQSSVSVHLNGSYEEHLFGIALTTQKGHSSGIYWTCSYYDKTSVASRPLINQLKVDDKSITIQLAKPRYSPREGLVYGYNLYYFASYENGQNLGKKIYVDENTTGVVEIKGLNRGTAYHFMAETLSLAGPSHMNASITLTTKAFEFSKQAIVLIAIALTLVILMAFVGCYCCIRWPQIKIRKWIHNCQPCMPTLVLDETRKNEQRSPSIEEYYVDSGPGPSHMQSQEPAAEKLDLCDCSSIQSDPAPSYSLITCDYDTLIVPFRSPNADILPSLNHADVILPGLHLLAPSSCCLSQPNSAALTSISINNETVGADPESATIYQQAHELNNRTIRKLQSTNEFNRVLPTADRYLSNHFLPKTKQSWSDVCSEELYTMPFISDTTIQVLSIDQSSIQPDLYSDHSENSRRAVHPEETPIDLPSVHSFGLVKSERILPELCSHHGSFYENESNPETRRKLREETDNISTTENTVDRLDQMNPITQRVSSKQLPLFQTPSPTNSCASSTERTSLITDDFTSSQSKLSITNDNDDDENDDEGVYLRP